MSGARRTWEETCALLRVRGYLGEEPFFMGPSYPRMPDRSPHPHDDDLAGIHLYKGGFAPHEDLSGLTLPRTFVGRSHVEQASFANTNLSESWLCWNNFTDVDFSLADLSRCDMRASEFERVSFVGADLSGADLRGSYFSQCDFTDARMNGAALARKQVSALTLSEVQQMAIGWTEDDGPEPDGG